MARLTLLLTVLTTLVALLGGFRYLVDTIREIRWRKHQTGKWLLGAFLCLVPSLSEAACTNNGGGVWTVSALNSTEMNACITAAASGDIIHVPSGSVTWSITLPSTKDLDIRGAGTVTCSGTPGTSGYTCTMSGTTTTVTGSPGFTIDLGASHTLSGFTITGGAGERISSTGEQNLGKHFRIHHNALISTAGWQPIRFHGGSNGNAPQGIWDHNRIENGVAIHTNGTLDQLDEGDVQHAIWAKDPGLGNTDEVVYLEDNYFVNSSGTTNYGDGNYAARSVIRFNTTNGPSIVAWEYHSPQGDNRGYQRWENYHNHHIDLDLSNGCFFGMHSLRGGTGVVFNNAMTGDTDGCNNKISMDNVRSDDNVAVFGLCDGTRTGIDQNTGGESGWRCRDQISISHDLSQWDHLPSPTAWNQNVRPAYVWGNTESASNAPVTVDTAGNNLIHIIANRDYYDYSTATGSPQTVGVRSGTIANRPAGCTTGVAYWATDEGEWNSRNGATADGRLYKCTATNTWTLYYTPYTYPHPWAAEEADSGNTIVLFLEFLLVVTSIGWHVRVPLLRLAGMTWAVSLLAASRSRQIVQRTYVGGRHATAHVLKVLLEKTK